MARTITPTGNFLVQRKNLFIRTECPWVKEKYYRGKFTRRMAKSDWSIFEENPHPRTNFAELIIEAWEPIGEITAETFDGQKGAETLPETVMTF